MASDATSGKTHASTVYAIFPLLTALGADDPAPPIGSEDPEDLPATDDRFEPWRTARVVPLQNVVPSVATGGADAVFSVLL